MGRSRPAALTMFQARVSEIALASYKGPVSAFIAQELHTPRALLMYDPRRVVFQLRNPGAELQGPNVADPVSACLTHRAAGIWVAAHREEGAARRAGAVHAAARCGLALSGPHRTPLGPVAALWCALKSDARSNSLNGKQLLLHRTLPPLSGGMQIARCGAHLLRLACANRLRKQVVEGVSV